MVDPKERHINQSFIELYLWSEKQFSYESNVKSIFCVWLFVWVQMNSSQWRPLRNKIRRAIIMRPNETIHSKTRTSFAVVSDDQQWFVVLMELMCSSDWRLSMVSCSQHVSKQIWASIFRSDLSLLYILFDTVNGSLLLVIRKILRF